LDVDFFSSTPNDTTLLSEPKLLWQDAQDIVLSFEKDLLKKSSLQGHS
jgi:hypothetical protein